MTQLNDKIDFEVSGMCRERRRKRLFDGEPECELIRFW